jgi:hypothetical protein
LPYDASSVTPGRRTHSNVVDCHNELSSAGAWAAAHSRQYFTRRDSCVYRWIGVLSGDTQRLYADANKDTNTDGNAEAEAGQGDSHADRQTIRYGYAIAVSNIAAAGRCVGRQIEYQRAWLL